MSVIVAAEANIILPAFLAAAAVIVPSYFGYRGIVAKIGSMDSNNTSDHGRVRAAVEAHTEAVRSLHSKVHETSVTVDGLLGAQAIAKFVSTADGTFVSANYAATQLLGRTINELSTPGAWFELVHPDDRSAVSSNWETALIMGMTRPPMVYRYVHPISGEVTRVRSTVTPVTNADGTVDEWVSLVTEIAKEGVYGQTPVVRKVSNHG